MKPSPWIFGLLFLGCAIPSVWAGGISLTGAKAPLIPNGKGVYLLPPGLGVQKGGNLFDSFNQFNLASGQTADFTATGGTVTIQNIIARVTGGASTIDGTIQSDISGANLFLLNPSGVAFGKNARLNVTGSFMAGTPDEVKLGKTGEFYTNTSLGGKDVLSSAPISAFGFLTSTPQAVTLTGSKLSVQPGKNFTVISGDITMNGASITASGGKLSLFSAAGSGQLAFDLANPSVGFNTTTTGSFGKITMVNQAEMIDAYKLTGAIALRGGKIMVESSSIISVNFGSSPGGDISVQGDQIRMQNASQIACYSAASGDAGNVSLTSDSLTLGGSSSKYSKIVSESAGGKSTTSKSGSVEVMVRGPLNIIGGGAIDADTFTLGEAGNVSVQAETLNIDGTATPTLFTGIQSESISSDAASKAKAGAVAVRVSGALNISGGGDIDADTATEGNAGGVTVEAGSLSLCGKESHISSDSEAPAPAQSKSGSVTVKVKGSLSLANGGNINADSNTSGDAGNVAVQANSLNIAGGGTPDAFTGIASEGKTTKNGVATANSGRIIVAVTDNITISGGGEISSNTSGFGNAGEVTVESGSLRLNGTATQSVLTGISSDALPGSEGNGGRVSVSVTDNVTLVGGSEISSFTYGLGNGGDVTIQAGSLNLDGSSTTGYLTGISSGALSGSGDAGRVGVNIAGNIAISDGGAIASSSFGIGNAGQVMVRAGSLTIDGSSSPLYFTGITSSTEPGGTGMGGSVNVSVVDGLSILGGGQIATSTFSASEIIGVGNAGTVMVQAGNLTIDGSAASVGFTGIVSDAESNHIASQGNAGTVTVNVPGAITITGGGTIATNTYTDGDAGRVTVTAGSVTLGGGSHGAVNLSSISSNAQVGTGMGGNVTLHVAGDVAMGAAGEIASGSQHALGGDTLLSAANLTLQNGATINAVSATTGGNLTLNINDQLYLLNSGISASAGGVGGNILIDPQFTILSNSPVSAFGGTANGNIAIDTAHYLNTNSPVHATGTLTISSPNLNLSGSLVVVSESIVDPTLRLEESCAQAAGDQSSFSVTDQGGIAPEPVELEIDLPGAPARK